MPVLCPHGYPSWASPPCEVCAQDQAATLRSTRPTDQEILDAISEMWNSVEAASKTPLWNYDTAQALIPGRNALFEIEQRLLAERGEGIYA